MTVGLELLGGQWPAAVEPLNFVTSLVAQEPFLSFGLDPFGNRLHPETVRHADDRLDNGTIIGIVFAQV